MRVVPVLGLSAALTLLMSGCRKQTGVDVDITTDVPCGTMRMSTGVQLGELKDAEITGESPQVVTQECAAGGAGKPSHVGDILVTASPGNDSATFRLTVMANLRLSESKTPISPEECKGQKYVDCIVARRTLGFIPNEGLTLPIFLQNACVSRICEEGTTCVADPTIGVRCVSSKIEQPNDCGSALDGCVFPVPVAKPEDPEPPALPAGDVGSGVGTTIPSAPPLYASTKNSFFKVDPKSLEVGPPILLKGCEDKNKVIDVHDIAITTDNRLYVVTNEALYEVKQDGTCVPKGGPKPVPKGVAYYPYTLATLPGGILSPSITSDMFIAQNHNAFLTISPVDGAMNPINLSSGPYASGDVVVVKKKNAVGVNVYLAANADSSRKEDDYLTQIDPIDGKEIPNAAHWSFKKKDVYGLAYWSGFFYGFTTGGSIIKMDETGLVTSNAETGLYLTGGASPVEAPPSP